MERPARLPRTATDLELWRVYSDARFERGDAEGAHLALELALPAEPGPHTLRKFERSAQQLLATPTELSVDACLGYARSVRVDEEYRNRFSRETPPYLGSLAPLLSYLARPQAALLQSVAIPYSVEIAQHPLFAELMNALPKTCEQLTFLDMNFSGRELNFKPGIERLPPQVRRISTNSLWPFDLMCNRIDELHLWGGCDDHTVTCVEIMQKTRRHTAVVLHKIEAVDGLARLQVRLGRPPTPPPSTARHARFG